MAKDNWIQGGTKEMEKRGTVGAFTKQANEAGMSVHDFAMKVTKNPKDFTKKTKARAVFALNMEKIAAKRDKMARGGTTQGYDDKQDESLGMRTGKQSSKKQSPKARRGGRAVAAQTAGVETAIAVRAWGAFQGGRSVRR